MWEDYDQQRRNQWKRNSRNYARLQQRAKNTNSRSARKELLARSRAVLTRERGQHRLFRQGRSEDRAAVKQLALQDQYLQAIGEMGASQERQVQLQRDYQNQVISQLSSQVQQDAVLQREILGQQQAAQDLERARANRAQALVQRTASQANLLGLQQSNLVSARRDAARENRLNRSAVTGVF